MKIISGEEWVNLQDDIKIGFGSLKETRRIINFMVESKMVSQMDKEPLLIPLERSL